MIILKSRDEIAKMATANKIVAEVLLKLKEHVSDGMTTDDLDKIAYEEITKTGGKPTFIGYQGYPKSICTSVNEEVVHGIPGPKRLANGDIIGLDCGVTWEGFVGDSAVTVGVGEISAEDEKLVATTKECLDLGIACVKEGGRIGDIGQAVQQHAEAHGYSVVRDFVGHGIGRQMHEEPQVPNYGKKGTGPRLKPGLVIAIEPMLNCGSFEVDVLDDKWTVVTRDKKRSAHFEHSIALTEDGAVVLSQV